MPRVLTTAVSPQHLDSRSSLAHPGRPTWRNRRGALGRSSTQPVRVPESPRPSRGTQRLSSARQRGAVPSRKPWHSPRRFPSTAPATPSNRPAKQARRSSDKLNASSRQRVGEQFRSHLAVAARVRQPLHGKCAITGSSASTSIYWNAVHNRCSTSSDKTRTVWRGHPSASCYRSLRRYTSSMSPSGRISPPISRTPSPPPPHLWRRSSRH